MPAPQVSRYTAYWSPVERGVIFLEVSGENRPVRLHNLSYEDFSAMVDLMRNESPVFYYSLTKGIGTGAEMIGESE